MVNVGKIVIMYLPSVGLDRTSPLSPSCLSGPVHAKSAVANCEKKSHQDYQRNNWKITAIVPRDNVLYPAASCAMISNSVCVLRSKIIMFSLVCY